MTQTVVGYFDTPDAAHVAEQKLSSRGIKQSALHLSEHDADSTSSTASQQTSRDAGAGGIRQFFSEIFGTDDSEDAGHYSEAVRRGGVVLTVDVPEGTPVEPVRDALIEAGAVNIDERVEQWRNQGYSGHQPEAQSYTADEVARERSTVLPVIEESLEVGKREVAKDTVRVHSRTVEKPVRETVNLREERAKIERRPVDREATQADLEALGERTVEVREMTETAVVNKTARVIEEVEIGKEVTQRPETIEDTVRHTEVRVDRSGAETGRAASSSTRAYEDYDADFRGDFETRYGALGGKYDEYEPAYRYGHSLGGDARYQGRDWSAIEPDAKREWSQRYPDSTWERFKLAIEHGWDRVTGQR